MTRGEEGCSLVLVQHVLDCLGLLLILVLQGSILDYYLILHNGGNAAWYFWFLADFLLLIAFMAAAVISYRYHTKKGRTRKPPDGQLVVCVGGGSRFGSLPLVYVVWFCYSCLLTAKVCLLFKMEVAQSLDAQSAFGPQLLKVIIASSAVVFLLLVETHNGGAEEQSHIHFLITSTVFEIFDSVTFLGILFPAQSRIVLTYPLENAILVLSCANFILPTLPLYKLSLSGRRPLLGLQLAYKCCHLAAVNVPYFVIRVYLWTLYDHDVTLFLLKNILAVVVTARTIVPETRHWWQESRGKRHVSFGGMVELGAVYESKKLQDSTEL